MLKAINIDRYLNIGLFIMLDSRRFNNIFGGLNLFYLLLFSFGGGYGGCPPPEIYLSVGDKRISIQYHTDSHGVSNVINW